MIKIKHILFIFFIALFLHSLNAKRCQSNCRINSYNDKKCQNNCNCNCRSRRNRCCSNSRCMVSVYAGTPFMPYYGPGYPYWGGYGWGGCGWGRCGWGGYGCGPFGGYYSGWGGMGLWIY